MGRGEHAAVAEGLGGCSQGLLGGQGACRVVGLSQAAGVGHMHGEVLLWHTAGLEGQHRKIGKLVMGGKNVFEH